MTRGWAVVTGASNGIGAVITRHAVKQGYRAAAWDIDAAALVGMPRLESRSRSVCLARLTADPGQRGETM